MKKITDFIVDKRYIILFIFIGLTIWCAFLSSKVKINYDMVNYLPSSSSTKKGMDIMNDEFNSTSSSLNIMVKDLDENEKKAYLDYLKSKSF